jgi:hypothetical protein
MMLIKQLEESVLTASSSCFEQMHSCLLSITRRIEKESQFRVFTVASS